MAMQASAADVRSILGSNPPIGPPPAPVKKTVAAPKKPDGISRELFALIGPTAPSLATQLAKPRLKQKPNLSGAGKVKWECRSFKNSARTDSLRLSHWVKASSDPNAEYTFARYNIAPSAVYTYSHDEYTRLIQDSEGWTKEETDYLFKMAQEFDLRWFIIHDRYEYEGPVRSLVDLKDRYYTACRKLVRARPFPGDQASKDALLATFSFDKPREEMRKRYLHTLAKRESKQIEEEEALYIEIKRLEQTERKFKREREDLLRTIAGIDSGLPDIVEDEPIQNVPIDSLRKRKRGDDIPSTPSISAPPPFKRPQSAKSAAQDAMHCIIRTDPPATTPATKAAHQPAYLRTFKVPVPKAAIAPKVAQSLAELGVIHSRLVMPTRDNSMLLESLLDATVALIETKKAVDKVDFDIGVAKERLGLRNSVERATPMDLDEHLADDGRAQSVLSARSGRGRKANARSMSVSSVDTSVTGPGRIKRQKRS
ncbi:hypothetical protein C8J56DRAFT_950702 [Mycena floridula]|nr:hypothetical protein C8J56DRAFT_950702 [Mycena floridula]